MAILTSFADPDTVRRMAGNPDDTEVTPDQITIYCNTAAPNSKMIQIFHDLIRPCLDFY
jgi:hypothetical protein